VHRRDHYQAILRGSVYGEWRAATGRPDYSKHAVVDSVDPVDVAAGARITVHGAGFVRGLTASWGNVPVDVTYVNATTVSFLVPPGALLPVLTLINPGQEPIVVDPAALVAPDIPTLGPGMLGVVGLLLACAGVVRLRG
jgi:IPT/TIG domain